MDANEAFESYKNRMKAELQNADANPMTAFSDTVSYALYGNHPRSFSMKENMVDKIDYDRVMEMYKDRFKDASDFTFYFVGENCAVSARQSSSAWGSFARVQTRQTMIWPLWTPRRRNT